MAALLRKSGQSLVQGAGRADWQEVLSNVTAPSPKTPKVKVGNSLTPVAEAMLMTLAKLTELLRKEKNVY